MSELREILEAIIREWNDRGWDCSASPGHLGVDRAIRAAQERLDEIDAAEEVGSVLGILLLKIGGTTIAVLVANGDQATVVDADPDYADGLRNHLRHGAWYPPGTPLAEYSFPAKAKGRDKLAKIGALYAKLFRAHALLSEIPDPIARKPDPT